MARCRAALEVAGGDAEVARATLSERPPRRVALPVIGAGPEPLPWIEALLSRKNEWKDPRTPAASVVYATREVFSARSWREGHARGAASGRYPWWCRAPVERAEQALPSGTGLRLGGYTRLALDDETSGVPPDVNAQMAATDLRFVCGRLLSTARATGLSFACKALGRRFVLGPEDDLDALDLGPAYLRAGTEAGRLQARAWREAYPDRRDGNADAVTAGYYAALVARARACLDVDLEPRSWAWEHSPGSGRHDFEARAEIRPCPGAGLERSAGRLVLELGGIPPSRWFPLPAQRGREVLLAALTQSPFCGDRRLSEEEATAPLEDFLGRFRYEPSALSTVDLDEGVFGQAFDHGPVVVCSDGERLGLFWVSGD